jgi:LPXTG-motif cell wall-anchored protein
MRSRLIVSSLIGAGIVAASAFVAVPATALDPVIIDVNCVLPGSDDVYQDVPIYAGQDAVFNFSPATCTQAYWSMLNPALTDVVAGDALVGTSTTTVAAADVLCDNELEIVTAGTQAGTPYYYFTFTGCEAAPAAAPEEAPLPDTGIDATALGLAAAGLLAAGVATIVVVRRRNA